MVEARHEAGDRADKNRSCNERRKQTKTILFSTAHNGLPNIYKLLRTSTQESGFKIGNSTREREFNEFKINWESSCARWKPQQANCHEEHVGGHKQCSTFRATWPTEVHPKHLSFFSLFSVCTIFLFDVFFFSSFFIAVFSFFGADFYCLSVFSLLYLLQNLFFFVSLFLLFFFLFSFSLTPFVNVLRNPFVNVD